jgi:hypothetical protein
MACCERIIADILGSSISDTGVLFSAGIPNYGEPCPDPSHIDPLNEDLYSFPKFLPYEPYLDAEGDETDETTCEGLTSAIQLIQLGEDRESTKYENAFPRSL